MAKVLHNLANIIKFVIMSNFLFLPKNAKNQMTGHLELCRVVAAHRFHPGTVSLRHIACEMEYRRNYRCTAALDNLQQEAEEILCCNGGVYY